MQQALVAFGRYVNALEGKGSGDRYIRLARFLLDCRYHAAAGPKSIVWIREDGGALA
jgi:hypothetical protein